MAIIKRINFFDFINAFHAFGRENQFTYRGLEVLFNYLDEGESDYELDVIGLCCTYIELSLDEIIRDYSFDCDDDDIDDDDIDTVLDLLREKTAVIGHYYREKEDQYYIVFGAF